MENLFHIVNAVFTRAVNVLAFPLDPENRIFWLYLVTSVLAAFCVYRSIKVKKEHATEKDTEAAEGTFLQFLFPKSVWSHPSAWLDLRYLFFHKIVSHFLLIGVGTAATTSAYWLISGDSLTELIIKKERTTAGDWGIAFLYMVFLWFILDLVAWGIHYLQHKVPLLWQFHKVHHSAEVMHPISNFREHPIDNLAYGFFIGCGYGVIYGLSVRFLGHVPAMPTLLGVPLLMFLFNIVAYNLRHSHVWLRWPGIWSVVFPSPAHHHVHHSSHPDHIDKNFAFMFPIWDVIFGTYTMPENNRDIKFGVHEDDARDLDSVLKLYWVPFRDAFRVLRSKPTPKDTATEETDFPAE